LLRSATAPAGKVKIKNGNEAAVAISESSNGEAPNALMSHVAAVSWAATQTLESTLGNHSATKDGFLSANQTEVFCFGSPAIRNRKTEKMTPIQRVSTRLIGGQLLVDPVPARHARHSILS
jgi:hypothetical protein